MNMHVMSARYLGRKSISSVSVLIERDAPIVKNYVDKIGGTVAHPLSILKGQGGPKPQVTTGVGVLMK
jgi:hypothetical protein